MGEKGPNLSVIHPGNQAAVVEEILTHFGPWLSQAHRPPEAVAASGCVCPHPQSPFPRRGRGKGHRNGAYALAPAPRKRSSASRDLPVAPPPGRDGPNLTTPFTQSREFSPIRDQT